MHILLLPSSYAPKVGGLETAVAQLGAELLRRGHRVTVVTNRYPRALPAHERIGGIDVHRILLTNVFPCRSQLKRLPKYLAGVALAPIQAARLARLFRRLEPTLINAHYLGTPAIYTRTANLLRPRHPLVLSVHGSDLTTTPYPTGNLTLSRYVVRGASMSTACSANQAGFLREMMGPAWPGRVIVTGNGVTPGDLQGAPPFEHPRPYILAAARFTPKKGIDVLIRALRLLRDTGLDVDLVLAGAGPEDQRLRELAAGLGLAERVRFWGIASRAELASLLHGCAVFALPSIWEAFGIASLEAMVCGKAVVASDCGGIPEVVRHGETGLLVPPGDAPALGTALAELLRDPGRACAMGQRGRGLALREFTWSTVTDRYMQAYRLALEA